MIVEPADDGEPFCATTFSRGGLHLDPLARLQPSGKPADAKGLRPAQAERAQRFTRKKLQRQNAHADQVAPVDALEAFRDHRADAEQERTLGGPIA